MKKSYFLLLMLLFSVTLLYSQTQRLVILEEFTQASCGPCASVNPGIQNLLNANPNKITSVWYHTNWPGYDPMNLHNPADVATRVGYYGVGYVPFSDLDGNYYSGSASGWNINTVNARYAVPSPFDLQLMLLKSATNDTAYLTMVAKATLNVSGAMVAHNIVIEKNIHFNTPPGSNGEKDFPNVMKKMLPTSFGTSLPASMQPGDYVIIETWWPFANVYDVNQIAGIGFIQNNSTKEIHQSCNSSTNAPTMPYNNDVQVIEISNISPTSCMGTITPKVKIRNNGNNTVTTVQFKYQVGNQGLSTYTWNGSLTKLQKATVTLPAYTFNPDQASTFQVYSVSPNNVTDEYPKNDSMSTAISPSKSVSNTLYLAMHTDNFPGQTTWDVKNSLGQVIKSGGPYPKKLTIYMDTIDLPQADCYTFTMYDSYGNGMCCDNGNGMYQLTDSQNTLIKQGGSFGFNDPTEFMLDPPQAIEPHPRTLSMNVYPNPFTNGTTVSFYLTNQDNVKISVYNVIGQPVQSASLGVMTAGQHEYNLDAGEFQPGIYFIRMETGSKVLTKKVTVIK